MARGKAVISSDRGSLGEVLGDAAVYFDPSSPEELSAKMDKLLTDHTFRTEYEEKGRLHSQGYQTDRMILEYLKELSEI